MEDMDKMTPQEREVYCTKLRSLNARGSQLTEEEQHNLKRCGVEFPRGNYAVKNICKARPDRDEKGSAAS